MKEKLFILALLFAFVFGVLYVIKITRPPVVVNDLVPSSFGTRMMSSDSGGVSALDEYRISPRPIEIDAGAVEDATTSVQ